MAVPQNRLPRRIQLYRSGNRIQTQSVSDIGHTRAHLELARLELLAVAAGLHVSSHATIA